MVFKVAVYEWRGFGVEWLDGWCGIRPAVWSIGQPGGCLMSGLAGGRFGCMASCFIIRLLRQLYSRIADRLAAGMLSRLAVPTLQCCNSRTVSRTIRA